MTRYSPSNLWRILNVLPYQKFYPRLTDVTTEHKKLKIDILTCGKRKFGMIGTYDQNLLERCSSFAF